MSTTLRKYEPRASDRIRQSVGDGVRAMASKQTTTARVLDRHPNVIGRICRGQVPSEFSRVAEELYIAAREGLDVEPLIVELLVQVERGRSEGRETGDLVAEWWRLTEEEPDAEAAESWAVTAPALDLSESASADKREAAIQIRRAAISEILAEREIDPRTWRKS